MPWGNCFPRATKGAGDIRNAIDNTGKGDYQRDNQKSPRHGGGSYTTDHFQVKTGKIFTTIEKIIDKTGIIGYTEYTKGATDRRFPRNVYREVTACLEAGRLLLFIFCLDNQGDKCDYEQTELQ